ncbi:MAG: hypothetical protein H0U10_13465 [Chloroflexia bacterium]|nr:hypothetical protein [Chloroflexia bacterium]
MAVSAPMLEDIRRPRWPERPFDVARAYLHYGAVADELRLWFDPEPTGWFSDLIDAPEGDDVAVMVGMDSEYQSTDEVVGIHVYPLLAGAARHRPHWRRLAEPGPPLEAVASFVSEVRDLFERYWTPAPPIDEQLARLGRSDKAALDAPTADPTP